MRRVRVGEVAVRREQLAIGVITVVVRGLALLLRDATHAAAPIQVIPVALAFRPSGEVAQRQELRACAAIELVTLLALSSVEGAVPQGVFYHRIEAVESANSLLLQFSTLIRTTHNSPSPDEFTRFWPAMKASHRRSGDKDIFANSRPAKAGVISAPSN